MAPPIGCEEGETELANGLCLPCEPGTIERDDGSCEPAGVPEGSCGEGFAHDGDAGCEPILPAEPCAQGQMAIPGETQCHPVMDCGEGAWGDIVTDSSTQFVDGSYAGGNSDGSQSAPWTTIDEAYTAASPGAVIAVAAGSYVENVSLSKAVTLWGRCPEMVEIVGTGSASATVRVLTFADGAVLRGLAVRGPVVGIATWDTVDLELDRLWIHDNAGRGLNIESPTRKASVTLTDSLIEGNHEHGIVNTGAALTIERTTVRANEPLGNSGGRGLTAQGHPDSGLQSTIDITRSVIAGNQEGGLSFYGGDIVVDATVVRETQPATNGNYGRGINVQDDVSGASADFELTRAVVEDNHEIGVFVGAAIATIENVVVRRTYSSGLGKYGRGISAQAHPVLDTPGTLTMSHSVVSESQDSGLFGWGAHLDVRSTIIRSSGRRGVAIQANDTGTVASTLNLEGCVVNDSEEVGLSIWGAAAEVVQTTIRGPEPAAQGNQWAIGATQSPTGVPTTLELRQSLIERHRGFSVALVGASGQVAQSAVRDTIANPDGTGGDAFAVVSAAGGAALSLVDSRTVSSERSAILNDGADVTIEGCYFDCQASDFIGVDGNLFFDFNFEGSGDNACGCGDTASDCKVITAQVKPPEPLPPLEASQ
jgi:hypothetical protein